MTGTYRSVAALSGRQRLARAQDGQVGIHGARHPRVLVVWLGIDNG